jgi:hypothetical protein
MAVKNRDKEEFNGVAGLKNKYLGIDSEGRSVAKNTLRGLKRAGSFGMDAKNDNNGWLALTALQVMAVFVGSILVTEDYGTHIDVDVAHDTQLHTDIGETNGVQVYHVPNNNKFGEADKYMLVNTDDGFQLYVSNSQEEITPESDNRFTLVTDRFEAAAISGEMVARYSQYEEGQLMPFDTTPSRIHYEGISPAYYETDESMREVYHAAYEMSSIHRIADEFEFYGSVNIEADPIAWGEAHEQFLDPDYSNQAMGLRNADHFSSGSSQIMDAGQTWLSIYAGLVGLGLAGGGVSGVNASRRRFNKQVKPK